MKANVLGILFFLLCEGYIPVEEVIGLTAEVSWPLVSRTEEVFTLRWAGDLGDNPHIVTRILNPGDVRQLWEALAKGDLDTLTFDQKGESSDLLQFFIAGEDPNINTPTYSCTWDPSIFASVIRSRRAPHEKKKLHLGKYRTLYGSRDFPAIAVSYYLGPGTTEMNTEMMKRPLSYYATNPLIIPEEDESASTVRYFDTTSTDKYLKFLFDINNVRVEAGATFLSKHVSTTVQLSDGVKDAFAWREVPVLGKTIGKDHWQVDQNNLAFILVFSYDLDAQYGVHRYSNEELVSRYGSEADPSLVIKAYSFDPGNRKTLVQTLGRYLYLFPALPLDTISKVTKPEEYFSLQDDARKEFADFVPDQAPLVLAELRSQLLASQEKIDQLDKKLKEFNKFFDGTKPAQTYSLETFDKKYDEEFEMLFRGAYEAAPIKPLSKYRGPNLLARVRQAARIFFYQLAQLVSSSHESVPLLVTDVELILHLDKPGYLVGLFSLPLEPYNRYSEKSPLKPEREEMKKRAIGFGNFLKSELELLQILLKISGDLKPLFEPKTFVFRGIRNDSSLLFANSSSHERKKKKRHSLMKKESLDSILSP